jgi:hypothetical protein
MLEMHKNDFADRNIVQPRACSTYQIRELLSYMAHILVAAKVWAACHYLPLNLQVTTRNL